MTISEHLRRYIAENNLSFRSLAAKLEMSYAHLNSIANGRKKASPAVKQRIADAIGIPVEQLDSPDRRVVQVAIAGVDFDRVSDLCLVAVAKLWSDGSVTLRSRVVKQVEEAI